MDLVPSGSVALKFRLPIITHTPSWLHIFLGLPPGLTEGLPKTRFSFYLSVIRKESYEVFTSVFDIKIHNTSGLSRGWPDGQEHHENQGSEQDGPGRS